MQGSPPSSCDPLSSQTHHAPTIFYFADTCYTFVGVFPSWNPAQPEITDLIVPYDPQTLARLPVRKTEVLKTFAAFHNRQAMQAIQNLPERNGLLDEPAIDRLMLIVHSEMQRLAEEFYHGHRVAELLRVMIATLRRSGFAGQLRVVDIGCGIGYTIRWLAAHSALPAENIELAGVDLNGALISEANRLTCIENLPCRFFHGDAFSPACSGDIFLSTGVIHHFRDAALFNFLRRHEQTRVQAFLHYDFQPWLLAPFGAWFFHFLRMRTAVAKHDGVLSAARAHSGAALVAASRHAAPAFTSGIYGAKIWDTPVPRVFHALVGIRRELSSALRAQLGRRLRRLPEFA